MPDDTQAIRLRFVGILLSAPCQKVDFWAGGLHVSGAGFVIVAHALSAGTTEGTGIGISVEDPGVGAAASYDYQRNVIVVPHADWAKEDRFERIALVHEAVHALRDTHGAKLTYEGRLFRPRGATDEAAAYVGGCLYDVYTQEDSRGVAMAKPDWLTARKSPTHALAYEVALRQAAKPRGSAIDRTDLSRLYQTATAYGRQSGRPLARYNDWDGVP